MSYKDYPSFFKLIKSTTSNKRAEEDKLDKDKSSKQLIVKDQNNSLVTEKDSDDVVRWIGDIDYRFKKLLNFQTLQQENLHQDKIKQDNELKLREKYQKKIYEDNFNKLGQVISNIEQDPIVHKQDEEVEEEGESEEIGDVDTEESLEEDEIEEEERELEDLEEELIEIEEEEEEENGHPEPAYDPFNNLGFHQEEEVILDRSYSGGEGESGASDQSENDHSESVSESEQHEYDDQPVSHYEQHVQVQHTQHEDEVVEILTTEDEEEEEEKEEHHEFQTSNRSQLYQMNYPQRPSIISNTFKPQVSSQHGYEHHDEDEHEEEEEDDDDEVNLDEEDHSHDDLISHGQTDNVEHHHYNESEVESEYSQDEEHAEIHSEPEISHSQFHLVDQFETNQPVPQVSYQIYNGRPRLGNSHHIQIPSYNHNATDLSKGEGEYDNGDEQDDEEEEDEEEDDDDDEDDEEEEDEEIDSEEEEEPDEEKEAVAAIYQSNRSSVDNENNYANAFHPSNDPLSYNNNHNNNQDDSIIILDTDDEVQEEKEDHDEEDEEEQDEEDEESEEDDNDGNDDDDEEDDNNSEEYHQNVPHQDFSMGNIAGDSYDSSNNLFAHQELLNLAEAVLSQGQSELSKHDHVESSRMLPNLVSGYAADSEGIQTDNLTSINFKNTENETNEEAAPIPTPFYAHEFDDQEPQVIQNQVDDDVLSEGSLADEENDDETLKVQLQHERKLSESKGQAEEEESSSDEDTGPPLPIFRTVVEEEPEVVLEKLRETESKFNIRLNSVADLEEELHLKSSRNASEEPHEGNQTVYYDADGSPKKIEREESNVLTAVREDHETSYAESEANATQFEEAVETHDEEIGPVEEVNFEYEHDEDIVSPDKDDIEVESYVPQVAIEDVEEEKDSDEDQDQEKEKNIEQEGYSLVQVVENVEASKQAEEEVEEEEDYGSDKDEEAEYVPSARQNDASFSEDVDAFLNRVEYDVLDDQEEEEKEELQHEEDGEELVDEHQEDYDVDVDVDADEDDENIKEDSVKQQDVHLEAHHFDMESEREEVGDVADQNDEEMNIKSERIVEEKYDTEVVQSQDEEISNDVKDFVVPQDVDEKSTESNIIPKLSEETTVDDDHYHPEEIEAPNLDTIVDDTIVDDTKNYEDITEHNIEIEIPSKEVEEVIGVGGEVINSAEFDKAPEVEESTVLPEHSETDHITEPSEPSEPSAKELVVVDEQVSQEVTFIEVPELQTVIEDSQHHTEVEEDEVSGNSSSVALGNILENLNEGLESEEVKIGVEEYVEEDVKEDVEEDVEEDVKEDVKEDVDVDVADADAVVEVEAEVKADSNDDKEEFNDEIDNSVDISIEEAKTYVEEEAPTIETNGVEVDQSNKEKHSDDQLVLEVEREEHPVIASNEQVADVEVDDDSLKEQHGVNEETNTMESTSSETKLEEDDVESTNKTETVSTETDTVQEDTSENLKKRKSATDITDAAFKKIRRIFSPFSWNETLDSTQKIIPKPELDEITEDTGPEVEEDQDIEIEEHINREEHETEEVDVIKDEDETDDNEAAEAPSTSDLPAEEPESLEQIVEVEVETKNEEEISTEDKVQDAAVIPEIETHPTHEQERNDDKIGDDLLDPELKIEKNQVQPEVAKSPPRKKKVVLGLEIEEFPIGPRRSLRNGHGYGAGAAPEVVTKDNSTPEPEMINEVTTPKHLIYDVKLELPKRGRRSTQTSPKVADEVISDVKEDHPKRGRRAAKASTESDNVIPDVKLDLPKRNLRGSKIAKEVDNVLPEVKLDIPKRGRRVTQAAAKSPKKVQKAVDLPKRKTGRPFKIAPVTEEDPSLKVPIAEETTNSRRASRRVSRTWDQSEDHPALRTRSRSPIKRSLSEEIAVAEVELSQGTKNLNARRRSSRLQKIEAEPDTVPETVPESEETSITPAEEMRGRGRKRRRQ